MKSAAHVWFGRHRASGWQAFKAEITQENWWLSLVTNINDFWLWHKDQNVAHLNIMTHIEKLAKRKSAELHVSMVDAIYAVAVCHSIAHCVANTFVYFETAMVLAAVLLSNHPNREVINRRVSPRTFPYLFMFVDSHVSINLLAIQLSVGLFFVYCLVIFACNIACVTFFDRIRYLSDGTYNWQANARTKMMKDNRTKPKIKTEFYSAHRWQFCIRSDTCSVLLSLSLMLATVHNYFGYLLPLRIQTFLNCVREVSESGKCAVWQ